MLLLWGQLRFVRISIPSRRTAPEVWPNQERSRNPSREPPQSVLRSERNTHSEWRFGQYGEICIPVRTLSYIALVSFLLLTAKIFRVDAVLSNALSSRPYFLSISTIFDDVN